MLAENGTDGMQTIKDACNAAGLNGKPVLLSVHGECQVEIYQCISALLCDGKFDINLVQKLIVLGYGYIVKNPLLILLFILNLSYHLSSLVSVLQTFVRLLNDMIITLIFVSGFCPGFYTPSELTLICTQLLPGGHLNNIRKLNNISHLIERFFQRVKNNLQIVLSLKHDDVANFCNHYPNVLHKFNLIDHYGNNDVDFWSSFCSIWLDKHMANEEEGFPTMELSRYLGTVHYSVKEHFVFNKKHKENKIEHFMSPLKILECLNVFQGLFKSIKSQSQVKWIFLFKSKKLKPK